MSKTMLSMEREKINFLSKCEDFQKQNGDEQQVRFAGDPITGLATDFADKIDFMTSISGQTSDMKQLNKMKERVRENYYGLPVQTLEKIFGTVANGETEEAVELGNIPIKEKTGNYLQL